MIRPASSRLEVVAIVAACVALTGATVGYAILNGGHETAPPLQSWQISGLGGLNAADQAIYSSLLAVSDEIVLTYSEYGDWLTPDDMQASLSPPFYRDGFWEQNGSVQWRLVAPKTSDVNGGGAYYIGTNARLPEQGAYLLVLAHVHAGLASANQGQVWLSRDRNPPPPTIIKPEALIQAGWRQIVPYRGDDEYRKVRGIAH